MLPVVDWEPIVLPVILIVPFKCDIHALAVDVVPVVNDIFANVFPETVDAVPIAAEI
jgi:hypothetical protein